MYVAPTFLGIGNEVSTLVVLPLVQGRSIPIIAMGLVFAKASIDDIFSICVLIGELEYLPRGDVPLPPDVADKIFVIHHCYEGANNVGLWDVVELVLVTSEVPNVVRRLSFESGLQPESSHTEPGLV